jgi:SAM-dependent methyltransferase
LFDLVLLNLRARVAPGGRVVELGIGPGYLAAHLLRELEQIGYVGVDFSDPMLDIARERLVRHTGRVRYLRRDLVQDDWVAALPKPVDAIVSTWSLHDLGSPEKVGQVYQACARALRPGGLLLNGDFIKPDEARHDYEPGRFGISRHLEMLASAGFEKPESLRVFEQEIESPTPAQNYACIRATMPGAGKMRVREIRAADVPALSPVRAATRENALSREELAGLGITEASTTGMLAAGSHRGWLCEEGGRVYGFAMGNRENGEMWVIAMLPEAEGQGLGARLLTRVEAWLFSEGWSEIWLTTDVDPSLRAYGFYRRQGWIDREIRDGLRYMVKARPGDTGCRRRPR